MSLLNDTHVHVATNSNDSNVINKNQQEGKKNYALIVKIVHIDVGGCVTRKFDCCLIALSSWVLYYFVW